jgi:hypothetical protein
MFEVQENSYARLQRLNSKPAHGQWRLPWLSETTGDFMTTTILTRTGQYVAEAALTAGIAFGASTLLYSCWSNVSQAKGSSWPTATESGS